MLRQRSCKYWFRASFLFAILLPIFVANTAVSQTPPTASCEDFGRATISKSRVTAVYQGRAATGTEAQPIAQLLKRYGIALQSGDAEGMNTLITPEFDKNIGWSECSSLLEPGSDLPEFQYTPLRVTTDDNGSWLAFIQRSYVDGSEQVYRDVFMVVAVEDANGELRIDFAHRDIRFEDGTMTDAEEIYLSGVKP